MTMQATQESSGGPNIEVVVPGSAGDPFTRRDGSEGAAPATTQSQAPASQPNAPQVLGFDIVPGQGAVFLQAPGDPQTPQAPAVGADGKPVTAPSGAVLTQADVEAAIRQAQSGWDRRISTIQKANEDLQKQLQTQEEQSIQRVREAQKANLTAPEIERMEAVWAGEDRVRALDKRESAVKDMFASVEGLRLLGQYGDYGVTEDDILAFKGDPTMLEDFVKATAFEKVQANGGKAPGKQAQAPAEATPPKPGANAKPDMSANVGAPPAEGPRVLTTSGINSMAANIKGMFS